MKVLKIQPVFTNVKLSQYEIKMLTEYCRKRGKNAGLVNNIKEMEEAHAIGDKLENYLHRLEHVIDNETLIIGTK